MMMKHRSTLFFAAGTVTFKLAYNLLLLPFMMPLDTNADQKKNIKS